MTRRTDSASGDTAEPLISTRVVRKSPSKRSPNWKGLAGLDERRKAERGVARRRSARLERCPRALAALSVEECDHEALARLASGHCPQELFASSRALIAEHQHEAVRTFDRSRESLARCHVVRQVRGDRPFRERKRRNHQAEPGLHLRPHLCGRGLAYGQQTDERGAE